MRQEGKHWLALRVHGVPRRPARQAWAVLAPMHVNQLRVAQRPLIANSKVDHGND